MEILHRITNRTHLSDYKRHMNVVPVLRSSNLPLSYLTNGQNVPDDIETADAHRLAQLILAM